MTSSDPRITYVQDCVCNNSIEIRGVVGKSFHVICGRCGKNHKGTITAPEVKKNAKRK